MKAIARCLVVLAAAGHIGLMAADAYARGPGGGPGGSAGTSGGHGNAAASSANGGHTNASSDEGRSPPAPAPAPAPPGSGGFAFDPGFGVASGACGVELQLSDPTAYATPLDGLAAISQQTESYIDACSCATQSCIADALDKYADALEKVAPQLPPAYRHLPKIVAVAAHQVRVAPTLHEAAHVVKAAVVAVQKVVQKVVETVTHKAIALMRAADPDAVAAATRGGDLVAHTLDTAAKALERAETL